VTAKGTSEVLNVPQKRSNSRNWAVQRVSTEAQANRGMLVALAAKY
jgi:hypothetical protein